MNLLSKTLRQIPPEFKNSGSTSKKPELSEQMA